MIVSQVEELQDLQAEFELRPFYMCCISTHIFVERIEYDPYFTTSPFLRSLHLKLQM